MTWSKEDRNAWDSTEIGKEIDKVIREKNYLNKLAQDAKTKLNQISQSAEQTTKAVEKATQSVQKLFNSAEDPFFSQMYDTGYEDASNKRDEVINYLKLYFVKDNQLEHDSFKDIYQEVDEKPDTAPWNQPGNILKQINVPSSVMKNLAENSFYARYYMEYSDKEPDANSLALYIHGFIDFFSESHKGRNVKVVNYDEPAEKLEEQLVVQEEAQRTGSEDFIEAKASLVDSLYEFKKSATKSGNIALSYKLGRLIEEIEE